MVTRAGEPLVQVEQVRLPPIRDEQLLDRHIEPDGASDVYALKVRGWATANAQPVTHFEVVHRGMVLETAPALPQGRIELPVSSLDLPYDFDVVVRAVLADQTRVRVAVLTGRRAALPGAPGPGPCPVLITMIGRTGSTAVSNLLCHHPDFAGYRTWDTETRVVTYWTSVLRALARPASYERQLAAAGPVEGNWWIGEGPPNPDFAGDPALPVLGRAGVEAVASFCRSQIGAVGSSLAEAAGKPGARYLVEKTQVEGVRSAAEVSEELDPRTREIVLVRDFRDVACSMLAYSREKGFAGFGPHDGASMEETIRWLSHNGASGLVEYIERRGDRAHVLRYEDLITHPAAALTQMLDHIGADASPRTVTLMLERLDAEREHRDEHATTDSAQASLGRWRRELDSEQQALAEHLFRPHLDALGYE